MFANKVIKLSYENVKKKIIRQGFPSGGDFKICGDELKLDILELQMNSKKNVLGAFYGSLETYTRYSWSADEKQKKKVVYE